MINELLAAFYRIPVRLGLVDYPIRLEYTSLIRNFVEAEDRRFYEILVQPDSEEGWQELCKLLDELLDTNDLYSFNGWFKIRRIYNEGNPWTIIYSSWVPFSFGSYMESTPGGLQEFCRLTADCQHEIPDIRTHIKWWKLAPKRK